MVNYYYNQFMKIQKTEIFGEVLGIIISLLVAIYLMPKLPFVTDDYPLWLPISIATTLIDGLISIIKHFFAKPNKYLFELVAIFPAMYSIYKLVEIFPFDFALIGLEQVNGYIKLAFQLVLVALVFGIIGNLVKFLKFDQVKENE